MNAAVIAIPTRSNVADGSCIVGAALIVGPGATWLAAILFGAAIKTALAAREIEPQNESVIYGQYFIAWRGAVADRVRALRAIRSGADSDSVLRHTLLAWCRCGEEDIWRGNPMDFGQFWSEEAINAAQKSIHQEAARIGEFRDALRQLSDSLKHDEKGANDEL